MGKSLVVVATVAGACGVARDVLLTPCRVRVRAGLFAAAQRGGSGSGTQTSAPSAILAAEKADAACIDATGLLKVCVQLPASVLLELRGGGGGSAEERHTYRHANTHTLHALMNTHTHTHTQTPMCALFWALETVSEDLWTRGVLCPPERLVMLGATSKRVRETLLGRLQRRMPAAVRVTRPASMGTVASGLPGLLAWCSVVRLDASGLRMGAGGVRMLSGVLGQCSSLATLTLGGNRIGAEGAGSLAGVLGQCSSLATLHLRYNNIGVEGAGRLAGVLGPCSSLTMLNLRNNDIGDEGARRLAGALGQCLSLDKLHLDGNVIGHRGIDIIQSSIRDSTQLFV